MFKNEFRIKSTSPLNGDKKKKLKANICKYFNLSTEAVDVILNHKPLTQLKAITHTNDIVKINCVQDTAIVFEFKNKLYPTMYLVWAFPNILPRLTLNNDGKSLLKTTSDLTIKVIRPENYDILGSLPVDQCVSLCTITYQEVIAIGYLTIAGTAIKKKKNIREKCLKVLHYYDDKLFKSYIEPTIPNANFAMSPCFDSDTQIISEDINTVVEKMDQLLMACSLKALKFSIKEEMLPILASTFYKKYVMSFCSEGTELDIKKTSFKKLSTFLQLLEKKQIIQLNMGSNGIVEITGVINSNNKFLDINNDDNPELQENTNKLSPPIKELYMLTPALLPIFSEFRFRLGDKMSVKAIRKYIMKYIIKNKLQDKKNSSNVIVNAALKNILSVRLRRNSVSIEKLIKHIIRLMYRTEITVVNSETAETIRLIRENIIPINMSVIKRKQNKKVTLVKNLELYGLDIIKFSKECQHGVAASTTINNIPNAQNRQVQIQGSHVKFVYKLLIEQYKIPVKFLSGYRKYLLQKYVFIYKSN